VPLRGPGRPTAVSWAGALYRPRDDAPVSLVRSVVHSGASTTGRARCCDRLARLTRARDPLEVQGSACRPQRCHQPASERLCLCRGDEVPSLCQQRSRATTNRVARRQRQVDAAAAATAGSRRTSRARPARRIGIDRGASRRHFPVVHGLVSRRGAVGQCRLQIAPIRRDVFRGIPQQRPHQHLV
jgi:hypothetical protein